MKTDHIESLCLKLGYHFKDEGLLVEALTHSSYKKSGKSDYDNERYEFLGDRVLNLILAQWFMEHRPEHGEGDLTLLMSGVHDWKTLSDIGYELELHKYVYIERTLIGREFKGQRDKILGNALEAIIGVIFKDGGYEAAKQVVSRLWREKLKGLDLSQLKSSKAKLQEYVQGEKRGLPIYSVVARTGPDHNPTFEMEVEVEGLGKARGIGSSKKEAEDSAAEILLKKTGLLV